MTNVSVSLEATGIAQAVDEGERYDSVRAKAAGLDHVDQLPDLETAQERIYDHCLTLENSRTRRFWALDIAGGQIRSISAVVNPDKLGHLGPVGDFGAPARSAIRLRRSR